MFFKIWILSSLPSFCSIIRRNSHLYWRSFIKQKKRYFVKLKQFREIAVIIFIEWLIQRRFSFSKILSCHPSNINYFRGNRKSQVTSIRNLMRKQYLSVITQNTKAHILFYSQNNLFFRMFDLIVLNHLIKFI